MKYILSIILAFSLNIFFAHAQFDIKNKVKNKVKERADQKVDKGIDDGLDKAEEGTKKKTKTDDGTTKTKTKTETDDDGTTKTKTKTEEKSDGDVKTPVTASLSSFTKFDFVPGDKVIFFDDFSQDNIGDFPAKWNTNGKGEVTTNNLYPGKWLKMRNSTTYLPEISSTKFPENYTLEYDLIVGGDVNQQGSLNLELSSLPNKQQVPNASDPTGNLGLFLASDFSPDGVIRYLVYSYLAEGVNGGATTDLNDYTLKDKGKDKFHVSVAVNKTRFRYYVNEVKVLDLPRVMPVGNYNAIIFRMWGWVEGYPCEAFISNFRYAEGTTDVRSKLMTEGKLVTRGITFNVASDQIKPESYGTLKEIAQVLKDNPAVKVKIIGHTDSDGAAATNLDLSKRRSASVKNSLIKDFGIDGARMETDGKGASEPASPNTSPEGKANNRRVEFIKM